MISPDFETFCRLAEHANVIPLCRRLMSDQLTPVLGYRRLVRADDRTAPSFLLESVEGGDRIGRHSFIGARPAIEIIARGQNVEVINHRTGDRDQRAVDDPLAVVVDVGRNWKPARGDDPISRKLPGFVGGWVGYAGYDTVRYLEPEKLPFEQAPEDDRQLADLHFGLYRQVGVFDHAEKMLYAICHAFVDEHTSAADAYAAASDELNALVEQLESHTVPLPAGPVDLDLSTRSAVQLQSNFQQAGFERAVERCGEYIAAGDAFQIVLSQRFERQTHADPFEVYRALRIVNPSPYMIYLQAADSILVASSPEILCRVEDGVAVNRPLAGTRKRGATEAQDDALEEELLADEKERAEHVMLVDLGRNDLGRVCEVGSIELPHVLEIERYSHVMHLSSTVTGRLRATLSAWDALRNTLPVGTVSGAPKIRAMQIIDELEPTRRGPYGGGIGVVSFDGDMDIALALRTMVIPTNNWNGSIWTVHLQAGAGIVADSNPSAEYEETVNKAAALNRAIDLAEDAFLRSDDLARSSTGRSE